MPPNHMLPTIKRIQRVVNAAGLDVVRYPPGDWVAARYTLSNILTKLDIDCVLDVGGNEGQFGCQLRDLGYRGHIISFEPVRAMFEVLSECAEKRGSWKSFNYALGRAEGKAEIHVAAGDTFSSFLQPRADSLARFPENRVVRSEEVAVHRLDSVLDRCLEGIRKPRIYLKIDTQGFDLEVLAGASGIIDRILALQTEISFRPIYDASPSYVSSLDACQSLGFQVVDFIPVTRDSDGLCAVEMDCVMARPA
jgi:FkbM family methyltransferase